MRRAQFGVLPFLVLQIVPVLAQGTAPAPAPAPAATSGGGLSWLWILLALVVVGGAIWYFTSGRNRTGTTSGLGVDRDRVAGSAQHAKGSVEVGAGKVLGDAKLQAEGRMDQAEGSARNTVGGVKDTLRGQ